jgi:PAS domain S-box-containing protein
MLNELEHLNGLAIIQDGRYALCDSAFATLSGHSIKELLSLPESLSLIHPEDREMVGERYINHLAGRAVEPYCRYRLVRKDGSVIWIEVCAIIVEYNNRPAVQTTVMDIAERQSAENAPQESKISEKPVKSINKMEGGGFETLLVVEDETFLRELTCRILCNRGYKVIEAMDGQEALRLAKEYEKEIHLILTDTVMPGMGGPELVERIRAFRPEIKSVHTSGYTDTAIVHLGILDRDRTFLQKPYGAADLTKKVRDVLDSGN